MKQQESSRQKMFTRRAAILGGSQLAMASLLGARLYYLQVTQADQYRMLAEENRINLRLLAPPRGRILDRFGVELAVNHQNYRLVVVPEQAGDMAETLDALGRVVPIEGDERERIEKEIARKRKFVPIIISEHLSWRQVAEIEVNAPYLPGVLIDVGQTRHYPHTEPLAHVLGYVAAVSEEELTGDPLLELPDFRIGKNGVERIHDLALRGRAGNQQIEVNAHGRVIRELSRNEGEAGNDVSLTIDLGLQDFAARRLGEESAAAAVLDVTNGEVLALASTPSFDPNAFNQGLSHKLWRSLVDNERAPLTNKAVAGQYPPGSTFKLIVALAALEAGAVDPNSTVYCPGHMQLGRHRFHCWKRGGHGKLGMIDGIAKSCDVYFYDTALKVGIKGIAAMARRLGLGARLGFDLPGEASGLIPTPDWKRGTYGETWYKGETLNAGIGQGYVLTTPLQLAVMAGRIANGGRAIVPRLTRAVARHDGEVVTSVADQGLVEDIGLSRASLDIVRAGMTKVVNHQRGTAYRSRIKEEEMAMAGKTGTSQVRRITKRERETGIIKNEDRPWKDRDHALFVAYAPLVKPRYACAVVIEHGGGGSKAAAPVARDILIDAQTRGSATGASLTGAPLIGPIAPAGEGEA
jgi:penicillin-binding protein 2